MSILGKIISPILFSIATSSYAQGKYEKAAKLYYKSIALDPQQGDIEYTYNCLGRCFKEIGDYSKALNNFSRSYDIYRKKEVIFKNDLQKREFRNMLLTYKNMLKGFGTIEKMEEVENEAKRMGVDLNEDEEEAVTSYHTLPK